MPGMKDTLLDLLPRIYITDDANGDLDVFLSVAGLTLDDLREAIDSIPALASPGDCPPDFLAYLGGIVGAAYDPLSDPGPQRERMREAVERYRRRGTTQGLDRELRRLGWDGEIIETYRFLMRLNYHAKLGRQKLPGQRYNHGILGVTERLPTTDFDTTIQRHQPAGTIVWTEQETANL
jgi:phage tail-like protein